MLYWWYRSFWFLSLSVSLSLSFPRSLRIVFSRRMDHQSWCCIFSNLVFSFVRCLLDYALVNISPIWVDIPRRDQKASAAGGDPSASAHIHFGLFVSFCVPSIAPFDTFFDFFLFCPQTITRPYLGKSTHKCTERTHTDSIQQQFNSNLFQVALYQYGNLWSPQAKLDVIRTNWSRGPMQDRSTVVCGGDCFRFFCLSVWPLFCKTKRAQHTKQPMLDSRTSFFPNRYDDDGYHHYYYRS